MVRTQVLLDEDQYEFLKDRSRETGESVSSIVRRSVERLRRSDVSLKQRAIQLLGAFEADRTDVSVRHDEYFAGVKPGKDEDLR